MEVAEGVESRAPVRPKCDSCGTARLGPLFHCTRDGHEWNVSQFDSQHGEGRGTFGDDSMNRQLNLNQLCR